MAQRVLRQSPPEASGVPSRVVRLAQIEVAGLFRRFDHRIPMNLDERITIIHGPNGVGKTTVLRLLSYMFSQRFDRLRRLPFQSMTLTFEDRAILEVRRRERQTEQKLPLAAELFFTIRQGTRGRIASEWEYKPVQVTSEGLRFPTSYIESVVEHLEQIGPETWVDRMTTETYNLEEVIEHYGDQLPMSPSSRPTRTPEWLVDRLNSVKVHLIETQRLVAPEKRPRRPAHREAEAPAATVMSYSADLANQIKVTLARYATTSQTLDRQFPDRLLNRPLPSGATEERIRSRYDEQGHRRKRLTEAGLLDTAEELALPERELGDIERRVLWEYLDDVDEKLSVFDAVLQRIEIFKDIINSSFRYKSLSIDQAQGFRFTTDDGAQLSPLSLSSGEQHKLVLTYELLFRVQRDALILIDEPELSLHVTWQHRFLDDLLRISDVATLDFLIATHAPQVIHKRTDLAVELGS